MRCPIDYYRRFGRFGHASCRPPLAAPRSKPFVVPVDDGDAAACRPSS
jgi:hypothetical protein